MSLESKETTPSQISSGLNLDKMKENITNFSSMIEKEDVKKKSLIFFIGNTGAGKTTLITYLNGVPLEQEPGIMKRIKPKWGGVVGGQKKLVMDSVLPH